MAGTTIVVLEGDETGQELLEEALRVLAPDVIGAEVELPRYDLSLQSRRATDNAVVHEAAAAVREAGLGLKGATVTPEGADDVGSPNRILREEIGGRVIVRTGRRIPGIVPFGGVHAPISVVRMAVATPTARRSGARARATTRPPSAPSGSSGESATRSRSSPSGSPRRRARRSSEARSTRSARSTRGC